MRWTRVSAVLMLSLLLLGPQTAWSQGQGGSSSSGMFGNRTTGSGITAGQSSAFPSNSPLSSLGQNGSGTPTMTNGVGGQARQAGSFIGASTGQSAQQNFVGTAQASPNGSSSQYGGGGSGMGGMGGGGMGGGGGGGGIGFAVGAAIGRRLGQQNTNTTPAAPPIRTTLTLSLEMPAVAPGEVGSAIAEHLVALPALHWQTPAQVVMQGRTAVLRGVVATEHDRDLAERVVRLEANVDQVQNNLTVAGRPATRTAIQP